MIWYLFYPLRGTTEPPQLPPAHPVRLAFQAHGTATARHWQLTLLLTTTVSVLLCYPAVFQHDSRAAVGLRNLPQHVWTSTTEVLEGTRPVDVEVRQVWIHGDFMQAIDHKVLREALHVQRALLADGFYPDENAEGATQYVDNRSDSECVEARKDQDWGLHSPLMYWGCSLSTLNEDHDLLSTINSRATVQSALNLTLRPSSVFAGKVYAKTKLLSADALVISLFYRTNPRLDDIWATRSRKLAKSLSSGLLFPENGQVGPNRLYEFRFKPMTLYDDIVLAASYMVTAGYVIWRMMQLRAIKSWFGLLITIGAKMTICVIGSFTVCTYLDIDLGSIPRPWFPAVVFCYGLGNIFRLINVVLETPPEMSPQQRIGHAIGQVGHLSVAVAGQNLVLIWLCSHFVTSWVADFCVFAAVTLVLDLVFHLTFFLAVLSVDVQRMELSDSLDRVNRRQTFKSSRSDRRPWLSALRDGTFSTRFAGSIAILSIILAINWHFFDIDGGHISLKKVKDRLFKRQTILKDAPVYNPAPITQARTPADWLRIQDHNTARELIQYIKPGAHSFIARIYDPLLVVLKGAHGRHTSSKPTPLVDSLRHFAQNHAFPAALIVVSLIAGITLLVNYLLWTGLPEGAEEEEEEDSIFTVSTLPTAQILDIVRIASSPKGHVVGISLDRTTSLWIHDKGRFSQSILRTADMKPKLWPITTCTLDDSGSMLALCTDDGLIGLWDLAASRFSSLHTVDLRGQVPILFNFATIPGEDQESFSLWIVTPDGYLTQFETYGGVHQTRRICARQIICCALYTCANSEVYLVFVSRYGEVHILPLKEEGEGTAELVAGLDPGPPPGSNPSKIKCVEGVPELGLLFALRDEEAEILDFNTRALIYAFPVGHIKPHSFRVIHSAPRTCICGAPAVHCLSVAYTEENTDHLIMQTFTLDESSSTSLICLGKPSDNEKHACRGLADAKEAVHLVEPAGAWESICGDLDIIGIRRCNRSSTTPSSIASGAEFIEPPEPSALKLRAMKNNNNNVSSLPRNDSVPTDSEGGGWEAWTLSSTGEFRSRSLTSSVGDMKDAASDGQPLTDEEELFVTAAGPITRLGKKNVAVGFGNKVKILGKETFDGGGVTAGSKLDSSGGGGGALGPGMYKSRSRRGPGRKVQ